MTLWLIEQEAWTAMEEARKAGLRPTAAQTAEFAASFQSGDVRGHRSLKVVGDVAQISVSGVLTRTPDLFALLFGGGNTTYSEIQQALAAADSDPTVKSIELHVASPGGTVSGLFETVDVLRSVSKPTKAKASLAASAAYALASATGSIEAVGPGATFGSIGVVASYYVSDDTVEITSTHAPDKRPDPRTEEGQAVIRAHLDEIHGLFAGAIAEGRQTTVDKVNADFGQGRVFLAAEAQRRGLIDSISRPQLRAVGPQKTSASATSGGALGAKPMKFSEYRAAHPEEAAQAIAEGVTQERERVAAHLTMGEQCGDLRIAVEAINNGVAFGHAPTQARYMSAAMNRRDVSARAEDDAAVVEATSNAEAPAARDLGDQLADLLLGSKETK